MRRRRSSGVQEEAEVDLTPMLDVVFIMLIFFIVTASFIKEVGIELNRPDAGETTKTRHRDPAGTIRRGHAHTGDARFSPVARSVPAHRAPRSTMGATAREMTMRTTRCSGVIMPGMLPQSVGWPCLENVTARQGTQPLHTIRQCAGALKAGASCCACHFLEV